jgi:hypothetical protein
MGNVEILRNGSDLVALCFKKLFISYRTKCRCKKSVNDKMLYFDGLKAGV